jgi:hypothetical protein
MFSSYAGSGGRLDPDRQTPGILCKHSRTTMELVLPEVPSAGGWTIWQALEEITPGRALASLILADREHKYRLALDRWEKAGAPRHCTEPAWYLLRGMFPMYTIDSNDRPRRIKPGEWPPNPALLEVIHSLISLEMGSVNELRNAFLSGELVAAGAHGHPGNPVVWLSQRVWSYYSPNVPTNEARWSGTGENGRTGNAVYAEIWEPARGRQPAMLIDKTYFGLRIFIAADLRGTTASSVDMKADGPTGAMDSSERNPPRRSSTASTTSTDWVLPTGVSQAVQIRAALDWLAHSASPPMPWKELLKKSEQSREEGRGEPVGWRPYERQVCEMLGVAPDDDGAQKTLANVKAVRVKWVVEKLSAKAHPLQVRRP